MIAPDSRIGTKRTLNDGVTMVCTRYKNANDISVTFSNGCVLERTTWDKFLKRKTSESPRKDHAHERLGAITMANNGQKMKVIRYHTGHDIDVQFEDGTVVQHRTWYEFQQGKIRNANIPKPTSQRKVHRIGIESTATNGQKMKVINYHNCEHIDVQFDDGTIVRDKRWDNFIIGQIANPNNNAHCIEATSKRRVGTLGIARNGLRMQIAAYYNAKDIDVLFEDGTIVTHKTLQQFRIGQIKHPGLSNTYRCNFCGYAVRMSFRTTDAVFYTAKAKDGQWSILSPQMIMKKAHIESVF